MILSSLATDRNSPEAKPPMGAYRHIADDLGAVPRGSAGGRELNAWGHAEDVRMAASLGSDASGRSYRWRTTSLGFSARRTTRDYQDSGTECERRTPGRSRKSIVDAFGRIGGQLQLGLICRDRIRGEAAGRLSGGDSAHAVKLPGRAGTVLFPPVVCPVDDLQPRLIGQAPKLVLVEHGDGQPVTLRLRGPGRD
jgi:hypothetical protein